MNIQNNDLKGHIFNNIFLLLKELENKNNEENTSLKAQINEINIQNNDLKKQLLEQRKLRKKIMCK